MISAFRAAEISTKNCEELKKIEQMVLEASNRGERSVRYEKTLDKSTINVLEELGYEVAFRKEDGGFTNESYIGW